LVPCMGGEVRTETLCQWLGSLKIILVDPRRGLLPNKGGETNGPLRFSNLWGSRRVKRGAVTSNGTGRSGWKDEKKSGTREGKKRHDAGELVRDGRSSIAAYGARRKRKTRQGVHNARTGGQV